MKEKMRTCSSIKLIIAIVVIVIAITAAPLLLGLTVDTSVLQTSGKGSFTKIISNYTGLQDYLWEINNHQGPVREIETTLDLDLSYYIRRVEVENFTKTAEYRENLKRYHENMLETEELKKLLQDPIEEKKTKVSTSYSFDFTKEKNIDTLDPQNISYNKDGYLLKGVVENGRVQFLQGEYIGKNGNRYKSLEKDLDNEVMDFFSTDMEHANYVMRHGETISSPVDKWERVNFSILFPKDYLNSMMEAKLTEVKQVRYAVGYPFALLMGLVLVGIFVYRHRLEELEGNLIGKWISRIPFEIPIFLFLVLLSVGVDVNLTPYETWFYAPHYFNLFFDWEKVVLLLIFNLGVVLFFYYVFLRIKDIIKRGWLKGFIQHSIVYHIIYGIKILMSIGMIQEKIANNNLYKQELTTGNSIKFFILLLIHGFILFVIMNLGFLSIPLLILYLGITGYVLWDILKNIDMINHISYEIGKGNYDIKIPEEKSYFKTIVHNINTISDNLDDAVSEAVKSEKLKTELITNVSHDLKTPLTSILNYSDLLEKEEHEEKIHEYSKIIHDKSLRLQEIIGNLFEASYAQSNSIHYDFQRLNFKALVEQMVGEWEEAFQKAYLTICLELPKEEVFVYLDGQRTSRILENIFSNMMKYSLENTRVYMKLFVEDGNVIFETKNISKEPLNISEEELMQRFTRGDRSRTTEGSGLGLSIAQSIAKGQKGNFTIEIDGDLFKNILQFTRIFPEEQ